MLPLRFHNAGALKVLCLGAHCDDIEIGCGGTMLKLLSQGLIGEVHWIVFTSTPARKEEAEKGASFFLQDIAHTQIIVKNWKDGFLRESYSEVKEFFEEIKVVYQPDLIFTHYRSDLHQDHRFLCELTWNTFRNHLILEYEIPKYDGDLGNPNFFIELSAKDAERKVEGILTCYTSQAKKHWFDKETFFALMRIRGMESASSGHYAEAFHVRKLVC